MQGVVLREEECVPTHQGSVAKGGPPFLLRYNAISLKNFFEVTVKCIRGREISTLHRPCQREAGGPAAFLRTAGQESGRVPVLQSSPGRRGGKYGSEWGGRAEPRVLVFPSCAPRAGRAEHPLLPGHLTPSLLLRPVRTRRCCGITEKCAD